MTDKEVRLVIFVPEEVREALRLAKVELGQEMSDLACDAITEKFSEYVERAKENIRAREARERKRDKSQ